MARHDAARYLSADDSTTVVHTAAQEPLVLDQPMFRWDDADEVAAFVHAHPWATMVSAGGGQPHVVSHLPVLLDASGSGGLCVSSHLARADADEHRLGVTDAVLILQGPHGYISPTFYGGGTHVPTWNFVVVHLHGRAEVLEPDETWDVLRRTVERFEDERQHPWSLGPVEGGLAVLVRTMARMPLR